MGFLRHIEACNRHDLTGFRPFVVAGQRVGWVRHALAERLPAIDPGFVTTGDVVSLAPEIKDFDERSAVVDRAAVHLQETGAVHHLRREFYPALPRWGDKPLLQIDRSIVPHFGINAYGLHVNGYVRRPDGSLSLWVARRAMDRTVEPGKLDNLVAGGQPIGLTIAENLLKESHEEAGLDAAMAGRAVPVGAITYTMETKAGLKPDTMFLYDLELPPDHVPANTDGEISGFELWPLDRVAESVQDTNDWKFNVNLVVMDFLVRHGWFKPDDPNYVAIIRGLRSWVSDTERE